MSILVRGGKRACPSHLGSPRKKLWGRAGRGWHIWGWGPKTFPRTSIKVRVGRGGPTYIEHFRPKNYKVICKSSCLQKPRKKQSKADMHIKGCMPKTLTPPMKKWEENEHFRRAEPIFPPLILVPQLFK